MFLCLVVSLLWHLHLPAVLPACWVGGKTAGISVLVGLQTLFTEKEVIYLLKNEGMASPLWIKPIPAGFQFS
jgi:hypothetical protein